MPETVIFNALSGLAIGASALVIGQRNPMYSVMMLIASFGALAGLVFAGMASAYFLIPILLHHLFPD